MKRLIGRRLILYGWQLSIAVSGHSLWYKKDWQCDINEDGIARFSRVMKIDTVELMRGSVEEGIE